MATTSLYRRILPSPPAIEFASPEGKQLFTEAHEKGNMEGFFKLISYFQTQSEPAYCGLATLSMVLNALAIDPGRKWKGPWRWFDESMLDCCEPLEKIKEEGITFSKVACLAMCNGADVEAFHTNQSSINDFREYIKTCTSSEYGHVISSYNRQLFKQTGTGHFSPIGGYHTERDMVLILDVARFKYPPHWVPLPLLWEAMDTVDKATGLRRGFMVIARLDKAPSLLYTLSCKTESWVSTAKYLVIDVPVLLKSDDVKDVQKVLSLILTSHPINFAEFIKWIVEVRRKEDGGSSCSTNEEKGRIAVKEEVLKQVKETKLFKHVTEWLSSATSCCPNFVNGCTPSKVISGTEMPNGSEQIVDMRVPISKTSCCISPCNFFEMHPGGSDILTVLLLALPPPTWSSIKDPTLFEVINGLLSTDHLPHLLQEEVLHLRQQLVVLTKCLDDDDLGASSVI